MISEAINLVVEQKDLPPEICKTALLEIMGGSCSEAQAAGLLAALRTKGETVEEITAFAKFLKETSKKIFPKVSGTPIDICGTGGDSIKTFNVSTAAAFVIAAAGVPVAKHGNRSVTSKCGSADILEALGANINLMPSETEKIIEQIGICFLFAPNFHPAMKTVSKIRKELGIRTIFNLVGPLTNPANIGAQVIGVYSKDLVPKFAKALQNLGIKRALVVHGSGMDEISTLDKTFVAEIKDGKIIEYTISPEDFSIKKPQLKELQLGATENAAQALRDAITGKDKVKSDIVALNAAAGIFVGGKVNSLKEGFEIARSVIESGKALKQLNKFIEVSQSYGGDILDKFIAQAQKNLENGYYNILPTHSNKTLKVSLAEKLKTQSFSLIAEIKHASPAGEYSFESIDIERTAFLFKNSGADAISVVVEPRIFKGKLENIVSAKKTGLPVLFKDFVIDETQIKVASRLGADCILLIVKVADRLNLDLNNLISTAHSFGLEVLLECYDKNEMERALETKADILGINNRDLRTLKIDLNRTKEILQHFSGAIDRPVISESGVRVRADAEFLKSVGASGILVGTALWISENQADKICELKLGGVIPMKGRYGNFGGQFVPELLMPALEELEASFKKYSKDKEFQREFLELLKDFGGRPTPLYFAKNFSNLVGCKVYLKREDLLYGGSHKLNNSLGQALLAKRMGKTRIITETAAGQHGISAVMAANIVGLETEIFMGVKDIERQASNVKRMQLLGAKITPVSNGQGILKDAVSDTLREWVSCLDNTHYLIGSAVGPHPFPEIAATFQSIIGREIKKQIMEKEKKLPDAIIACGSGGSNAIGAFRPFLSDSEVELYFVEGGGQSLDSDNSAAALEVGSKGVLHGCLTYVLQDSDGQIKPSKCRSAGLNYPARGPEIAHLFESGRIKAGYAFDSEVFKAVQIMCKTEGLIPALETAHAIAFLIKERKNFHNKTVVLNYSGRGDKDIETILKNIGGSNGT